MEAKRKNQMQLMLESARARLTEMTVPEIVKHSGTILSGDDILIRSMDRDIRLRLPQYDFDTELDMWHHLTLLQYLFTADGEPLSGRWIALDEMPSGLSRGYGFNKDISLMFERAFGNVNASQFAELCLRLGGKIVEGKADASAVIMYAPRFPILINFWERDEEFPCSGKAFVDANAHHYLTVEAAGGACSAVVQRLTSLLLSGVGEPYIFGFDIGTVGMAEGNQKNRKRY